MARNLFFIVEMPKMAFKDFGRNCKEIKNVDVNTNAPVKKAKKSVN